jgi:hypothetical protein
MAKVSDEITQANYMSRLLQKQKQKKKKKKDSKRLHSYTLEGILWSFFFL